MAASLNRPLRVAVEGCGHGTLDDIYYAVVQSCVKKDWESVDLLIICGDFQAVRNAQDLNCMAVPDKYRKMGDFHKYYSGERKAPCLTIFIGGNHEASNHLWELFYGGWVAPNIYYMGAANVLRLGHLRIAGFSGIYNPSHYNRPHYERLPFGGGDVRSIYHQREFDARKLLQIRNPVDVGLSHDWPVKAAEMGNVDWLLKTKPYFVSDVKKNELGSPAAQAILEQLWPSYWFSAHLHVKYTATFTPDKIRESGKKHSSRAPGHAEVAKNSDEIELDLDTGGVDVGEALPESATGSGQVKNTDEIDLDVDDDLGATASKTPADDTEPISTPATKNGIPDDVLAQLPASFSQPGIGITPSEKVEFLPEPPTNITNDSTQFLALDKCLPNRDYLELLEIDPISKDSPDQLNSTDGELTFSYDPEWLAITRVFANHLIVGNRSAQVSPDQGRGRYRQLVEAEEQWVHDNITAKGKLTVPQNFVQTAPPQDEHLHPLHALMTHEPPREYNNPQTATFCSMLDIPNPFGATEEEIMERQKLKPQGSFHHSSRGGMRGGGRGRGRGRGGGQRGYRGNRGQRYG